MECLTLASQIEGEMIAMAAVGGGFIIAIMSIVSGSVVAITKTRQREETRREIAAYVAEGTMTPQDAERLMESGMRSWEKGRGNA